MGSVRLVVVAATTAVLLGPVAGGTAGHAATARSDSATDATSATSSAPRVAARTATDWTLLRSMSFSTAVSDAGRRWVPSDDGPGSRYDVDGYDDDGGYFDAMGGADFRRQLGTFQTLRKRFAFGPGGWLTAEMSARDTNRDGRPDRPPRLRTERVAGNPSLLIDEPSHHGGVVIRSTEALPAQYRVEVRLRTIDFGGQRNGSWDYPDGRINGYSPAGCKTNHPWAHDGSVFAKQRCSWRDVRTDSNGFYYLSVMDYPRPAPHNNVFIHTHRKVVMDGYNRYKWTRDMLYCNPATKEYEPYYAGTGNGVNMIFPTAGRQNTVSPGTAYVIETECGTTNGPVVSAADLRPELLPDRPYRFAIERDATGYTLETSGVFAHVGRATLRYHRDFVEDGVPIWHYNQTAAEYDGSFNRDWSYTGDHGTYTDSDVWPAGSAYPDFFMIGDPHTNYYEGRAHIDDVKLFVPAESTNRDLCPEC